MKMCFVTGIALLFLSCSMQFGKAPEKSDQVLVSVISWNLQTFFDAKTVGSEYADYRGSKSTWSEDKYKKRLKRVCEFIEKTQADVYVFQELENSSILQDIANELAPLQTINDGYGYSCFTKKDGEALGIGIVSKYELKDVQVHQVDLRVALGLSDFSSSTDILDGMALEQPSMRALLRAKIIANENDAFSIYACHWKSKVGGAEKSELWRNAQEMLLADTLLGESSPFLIVGDFNRNLEEFSESSSNNNSKENLVLLRGRKKSLEVVSLWREYENKVSASGSYYYQGEWEKIDHIFSSTNLRVIDFQTLTSDMNVDSNGIPLRYDMYSGSGTSDHLPLLCVVEM